MTHSTDTDTTDTTDATPTTTTWRAPQGALAHRNFTPLVLAGLPAVLAVVAMAVGDMNSALAPFASLSICVSWLTLALMAGWNVWPHQRRGAMEVDRRGVFIDGALALPIDRIATAVVARTGWHTVVRLRLKDRRLAYWLRVPGDSEEEARAAVAALGLDAAHVRTSFSLPSRLFRGGPILVFYMFLWFAVMPLAILLGLLVSVHTPHARGELSSAGMAAMFTSGVALVASYWTLYFRSRLDVTFGADGIWMRQWGKHRLVRWAQVGTLEPWPGALVRGVRAPSEGFDLVLRDGERIRFCTSREWMKRGYLGSDAVAEALRAAMGAASHAADDDDAAPQLPPKAGRTTREWLGELRLAGRGDIASLRHAALDPERLWRVALDPDAAAPDRAAAAAALSGASDGERRTALRDAAAMIAEPKLRVAVEAAAAGDDDALVEALDALDIEDTPKEAAKK